MIRGYSLAEVVARKPKRKFTPQVRAITERQRTLQTLLARGWTAQRVADFWGITGAQARRAIAELRTKLKRLEEDK